MPKTKAKKAIVEDSRVNSIRALTQRLSPYFGRNGSVSVPRNKKQNLDSYKDTIDDKNKHDPINLLVKQSYQVLSKDNLN